MLSLNGMVLLVLQDEFLWWILTLAPIGLLAIVDIVDCSCRFDFSSYQLNTSVSYLHCLCLAYCFGGVMRMTWWSCLVLGW